MARVLPIDGEEWIRRVDASPEPRADDCSITLDGRHLDSKDAVLAFLEELKGERLGEGDGGTH